MRGSGSGVPAQDLNILKEGLRDGVVRISGREVRDIMTIEKLIQWDLLREIAPWRFGKQYPFAALTEKGKERANGKKRVQGDA